MTRILYALTLTAAMAGLVFAGGITAAAAQDKKAAKDAKATGTIEVNEGKDGKYRFFIRDAEGKLLAMSGPTGFEKKDDAVKALDHLKDVLATAKVAPAAKKSDKDK